MWTLAGRAEYEEDIRKSRFLALAEPVQSADQAAAFLAANRRPDATHHCWAWRLGAAYRFHDDGEPGGTAGRPILQAVEGQDCDRVVVLVVRWFGGVKLGTGGLARAYGGVAAQCLRSAEKIALVDEVMVACDCVFADMARVRVRLEDAGARIEDECFTEVGLVWRLAVARDQLSQIATLYTDLTRGQGRWRVDDDQC
ncbi:MAG: IMPACT family protein [Alcaligenaceae bacterium]|nr:IMPACT family protein [Alcaligenaceae bacterium]